MTATSGKGCMGKAAHHRAAIRIQATYRGWRTRQLIVKAVRCEFEELVREIEHHMHSTVLCEDPRKEVTDEHRGFGPSLCGNYEWRRQEVLCKPVFEDLRLNISLLTVEELKNLRFRMSMDLKNIEERLKKRILMKRAERAKR
eukprot:Nk52_evm11s299 gene=Nk52_evmTU11s299